MAVWQRFRRAYFATGATSHTIAFNESSALGAGYTLTAVVYVEGTSGTIVSNSWGATALGGSSNNGSFAWVGAFTRQGNGSVNNFMITLDSNARCEIHLYAFKGYVSEVPNQTAGTSFTGVATAATPATSATTVANTIAIAAVGLNGLSGGWQPTASNGFSIAADTDTDGRLLSAVRAYTASGAAPSTTLSWTTSRTGRAATWVIQGVSADDIGGGDTAAPVVTITSPQNLSTVSGTVTLQATATDNVGVTGVNFYVGDTLIGPGTFSGGNWSISVPTTSVPDGIYLLRAEASDAAGNIGTTEITLIVNNDPTTGPVTPLRAHDKSVARLYINGVQPVRAYQSDELVFGTPYIPPIIPGDPPAGIPTRVSSFGPNGTHYPTRTHWVTDPAATVIHATACTWAAIQAAITTATTSHPNAKVTILVPPGNLPGNGAGSTSTPVLQNLGATGRPHRILVAPRDGVFSITHTGSMRLHNLKGITFLGFSPWGLGVAPTSAFAFVFTGSTDVAWAWSKARAFNITNTGATGDTIELVECTAPELQLHDDDRSAFRNASGGVTRNVLLDGCWWAPSYKNAGSSAHCDTLQFSGNTSIFDTITIRDSAMFASTNAALITTGDGVEQNNTTKNVIFEHSILAAGNRGLHVYPLPGAANQMTSGYPIAFNAEPIGCIAQNSYFMGKIVPRFASVTNTRITQSALAPTSGSWTIDTSIGEDTAWFTANAPKPTDAVLQSIWAW